MAEFKTVMREFQRLCSERRCGNCPVGKRVFNERASYWSYCCVWIKNHPEEAEPIIMRWAKENPVKTNRGKFKEVFGCEIVTTHESHEAVPGHVTILNASDEEFEQWLNAEYKGGEDGAV